MQFIDICYKFCSLDSRSFRSCRGCFLMLCVCVCFALLFSLIFFLAWLFVFFLAFYFLGVGLLLYFARAIIASTAVVIAVFVARFCVCVRYVFFSSASRRNKKSNQIEIKSSKIRSERSFARALFDGITLGRMCWRSAVCVPALNTHLHTEHDESNDVK